MKFSSTRTLCFNGSSNLLLHNAKSISSQNSCLCTCTYPNTPSTFNSNRRSFKYNASIIQVSTCTWGKPKIEEYELRDVRTIYLVPRRLMTSSHSATLQTLEFWILHGKGLTPYPWPLEDVIGIIRKSKSKNKQYYCQKKKKKC
jgi:hypothetical protein